MCLSDVKKGESEQNEVKPPMASLSDVSKAIDILFLRKTNSFMICSLVFDKTIQQIMPFLA